MNIFELDPYDNSQLEKIKVFEEENECTDKPSEIIMETRKNISKEEYYDTNNNELDRILITEKNDKITDCCYILGEKDIKQCKITPITTGNKRRETSLLATDYALKTLGMEVVFIPIPKGDDSMINYLELRGYENLGEIDGNIILLKEEPEKENSQRMIS